MKWQSSLDLDPETVTVASIAPVVKSTAFDMRFASAVAGAVKVAVEIRGRGASQAAKSFTKKLNAKGATEDVQDAAEEAQQVLHGLQFTKCAPAAPQHAAHRRACATRDPHAC